MKNRLKLRKILVFFTFFQVDFFVAVETTAIIVAAPRIAESYAIGERLLPWILNSYFLSMFLALGAFLLFEKTLSRKIGAKRFFLEGMIYFILGSVIAGLADSIQLFFFARVVQGVGAAMVSVGQLWAMAESYRDEIEQPLFWADTGFVIGIVSGPFLGGALAGIVPDGWRWIFALNAAVAVVGAVLFGQLYRGRRSVTESDGVFSGALGPAGRNFFLVVAVEIIVSSIAVAQEFIVSAYLQNFRDFTPLAAGAVLFMASIGVIAGGGFIANSRRKSGRARILDGLQGMVFATIAFGLAFHSGVLFAILPALFLSGFFFGWLNIVIFSYISRILDPSILIRGTIVYLIALQLGNVFGVGAERLWSVIGRDFLVLGLIMIVLLQVALFFTLRIRRDLTQ